MLSPAEVDAALARLGMPGLPPRARVEVLEAEPGRLRLRHPGDGSRLLGQIPGLVALALAIGVLWGMVLVLASQRAGPDRRAEQLAVLAFLVTVAGGASSSVVRALMPIELELDPGLLAVTRRSGLWRSRQRLQLGVGALARLWRRGQAGRLGIQVFGARHTLALASPLDDAEARWLVEAMNAMFLGHFDPFSASLDAQPRSMLRSAVQPGGGLCIDLIGARSHYTWVQRLIALGLLVGLLSHAASSILPWRTHPWPAMGVHTLIVVIVAFGVFKDRLYFYRVTVDKKKVSVQSHRDGRRRGYEYSMPLVYVLGVDLHTDSADPGCYLRGALRSINLTPEHDLGTAVHVGRVVVRHLRELGAQIEASPGLDVPPPE